MNDKQAACDVATSHCKGKYISLLWEGIAALLNLDVAPGDTILCEQQERLCPWMLHPSGYMMETVNSMVLLTSQSDKEFIDIVETIYRGARKGRGLVMSPKDSLACLGLHIDVGGSEGSKSAAMENRKPAPAHGVADHWLGVVCFTQSATST